MQQAPFLVDVEFPIATPEEFNYLFQRRCHKEFLSNTS
jgi:hypothetical protein